MDIINFNKKVNRAFSKYFSLNLFYIIAELFLFYSIWFLLFSIIDNILNFNVFFRWLNLIVFMILFGRRIFSYYLKLKEITRKSVLVKIEDKYDFKDTVISGYELQNSDEFDGFYISQVLKQAVLNLKKMKFSSIVNIQRLKKEALSLLSCILFLSLYSFALPDNFNVSINRFVNPAYKIKYTHKIVKLDIYPKNIKVLEGGDVRIKLITFGSVKDAFLVMKNKDNIITEKFSFTRQSNVSTNVIYIYDYNLKGVYDDFIYYGETIQTRDNIKIKTPEYNIKVVKEPSVKQLKIVYLYPSYTCLKPVVVEDNGNIEAVEKTVIKISGKANNNLSRAVLFYNNRKIKLSLSDNSFMGRFMLAASGKYYIKFRDENYNTNTRPVNYSIIVTKDQPPVVDIVKPGMDITLQDASELPLVIYAHDDHAVNDLKLFFKIKKPYIKQKMKWATIPFEIQKAPVVNYKYGWDIGKLRFMPGDIIEYYAQVYDGYKPAEKHTVQSRKYIIKFPTVDEMYRQLDREQEQHVASLESILKDQKKLHKETEKLIQDMEGKKEMSYIEKKGLEKLKENQIKIAESVEKLAEKLSQTYDKMKKKDMYTLEIMEKMQAVKELLDEVSTKKMQEAIEKLYDAVRNIKLSDVRKKSLSQKITQEEILKRLEKTMHMLKEMKNRQKLESYRKITDELIEKQKELLNKTMEKMSGQKDHDSKRLKEEQEAIKNSFNKMKEDMKKFEDQLKKEKSDLRNDVSGLNKKMDSSDINKDFNQSASSLEKNELSDSVRSQKQILSKMSSINSGICKACAGGMQMDISKILNALDQTIFNLLKTSEKIEIYKNKINRKFEIIEKFLEIEIVRDELYKVRDNNEIAEDLIYLERSIRWNKRHLELETQGSITFSPSFFDKFEDLGGALSSARNNLAENRLSNTRTFMLNAFLYNNIILKDLLELKESFKNQMQNMSSQGMSDMLNQMANAQEKLNELTERLKGQIGNGEMSAEMQQYLEELAFQQEMIKKGVESFMNNYQQAGKLMGDLNQAAKEMNEIKDKLKSKRVDNDLIQKQKKVLKRLLDSERSLYVKDKTEKREAQKAKEYHKDKPGEIADEKVDYKSKDFYHRSFDKYPLEYKQLIDDYFKVLNSIER